MRKDHRIRQPAKMREDGTFTTTYREGGKSYSTKEYTIWQNMYNRVNHPARHIADPKYADCKLGFEGYELFVGWARAQKGFNQEGWVLDKDIVCHLKGKDVKIYSPDTCVFIPIVINSFLAFSQRKNNITGYAGVSWQNTYTKSGGKFIVSCAELNGKNKTLGRTNTAEEGYQLYRTHKIKLAKILADTYRGQVDERVTYYLDNFDKYIDDLAIFNK